METPSPVFPASIAWQCPACGKQYTDSHRVRTSPGDVAVTTYNHVGAPPCTHAVPTKAIEQLMPPMNQAAMKASGN